jgi:hypothetical protein
MRTAPADKMLILDPEDYRTLERILEDSALPERHRMLTLVRKASPIRDLTPISAVARLLPNFTQPVRFR